MSFYSFALFAHILGVLSLFIGLGLEWTSIVRLRRAQTVAQIREWTSLTSAVGPLMMMAMPLILVAGIYMMITAWGWLTPWIDVSLAALIFMSAPAGMVYSRRLKAIQMAAVAEAPTGRIPAELQSRITDPVLWTMVQTSDMIILAVVFLMTTKPDLVGSLITLIVALIIGVVSAQLWRPRQGTVAVKGVKQRHPA